MFRDCYRTGLGPGPPDRGTAVAGVGLCADVGPGVDCTARPNVGGNDRPRRAGEKQDIRRGRERRTNSHALQADQLNAPMHGSLLLIYGSSSQANLGWFQGLTLHCRERCWAEQSVSVFNKMVKISVKSVNLQQNL